ncbi:response regulator [Nitrincola sp.]|uniref:response regulator n=1 Tax=Nitrincola sp. TaxID=1926584 RepID=UPI003A90B299
MNQLSVLIVDDAKFICELVSKIVKTSFPGSTVTAAYNGQEAQSIMQTSHFDLILCDWEMPKMSGLELLTWTRQQTQYKATPFVMVTSRGERSYVLKAIQAGVNDYLGKPFTGDQLTQKMNKLLSGETRLPNTRKIDQAAASLDKAENTPPIPAKSALKPKGLAQLRVRDQVIKCAIKDLSLRDVLVVIKNEGVFPTILDQAVVDIEQLSGGSVARVNGFVERIEAMERKIDAPFINVKVAFVDDDPDKMDHLAKYIASVR